LACGCNGKADSPVPAPVVRAALGSAAVTACEPLPFAASTPVAEASGATWLTVDGALRLVVAADSGNHGEYGLIDPDTGATVERGKLPLNGSTDDIEGLATRGDHVFGITSPGWILEWKRVAGGFELVRGPTALGPVDLPPKGGLGDKPPQGDGMVCDGTKPNCGRNYEGLCLTEHAGYAAAKADGHLYPIVGPVVGDSELHVERAGAIAVAEPGHLADCAYDEHGTLYVGNNLFGLSTVSRVDLDAGGAKVVPIASLGMGFPEVLAVRGDVVYRMSDTGGSPSLMGKFRCKPSAR
ncbi:MAG TPA: hypothetical protein VFQ65_06490, partial [Kofleriaceae bacterium]|nr:hypothetical protein [Kofleriaceae bacterium]